LSSHFYLIVKFLTLVNICDRCDRCDTLYNFCLFYTGIKTKYVFKDG